MKLYIDHYSEIHKGKTMAFAAKEGILRDNHSFFVEDLKFLTRIGVKIILLHNITSNLGNNTFIRENIIEKLPDIDLKKIPSNIDFYNYILDLKLKVDKLIFLERQFLQDENGNKINTMSTEKILSEKKGSELEASDLGISNINFRDSLLQICNSIEGGNIDRIHILPGGKRHVIKNELFSIEGDGTIIGKNFGVPDIELAQEGKEQIILGILNFNKKTKFLKPRNIDYIKKNIKNFFIAYIDGIPVGCVENINIDKYTIELGALSVIEGFSNFMVGKSLINQVELITRNKRKILISLTNNPLLQDIYKKRGYKEDLDGFFADRKRKSPGVKLFFLE